MIMIIIDIIKKMNMIIEKKNIIKIIINQNLDLNLEVDINILIIEIIIQDQDRDLILIIEIIAQNKAIKIIKLKILIRIIII